MERKTIQRVAIEQVFLQTDRPLRVEEVLKSGRRVVDSLNQATVYRNLKLLVDDGWLKRVSHPTLGILYERAGKGHHHHFHCRACNRAFELTGCALKEEGAVPGGFVIEDHEIFLSGLCPTCGENGQGKIGNQMIRSSC